ncbi:MAG: hypothetical protein ACK5SP_00395 [bacterium]
MIEVRDTTISFFGNHPTQFVVVDARRTAGVTPPSCRYAAPTFSTMNEGPFSLTRRRVRSDAV